MNLNENNPISNGTYTLKVVPGYRYAFGASSSGWAGTLTISWVNEQDVLIPFQGGQLTANGGFEFVPPSNKVALVLTGASNPVYIDVAKIPN